MSDSPETAVADQPSAASYAPSVPRWRDAERNHGGRLPGRMLAVLVACSGAVPGLLWLAGRADAATAVFGMAALAAGYAIGLVLLRLLLSAGNPVVAVARAIVEEAGGTRSLIVLVMLLVVGLPILPLVLDGSERLAYRTQFFLAWSLSGASCLLSVICIVLACGSVCGDIASQRIHMTLVKPLGRWQYVLGKWVGIMALNALLVALVGIGIYAFTNALRRAAAEDAADRTAVDEQVLTARRALQPLHPRRDEFDQAIAVATARIEEDDPVLFAKDPERARRQIRNHQIQAWHTVTAGVVSTFLFDLGGTDRIASDVVQLRLKAFSDHSTMDRPEVRFALWLNDRPFPVRQGRHEEIVMPTGSFQTLDLPTESIDENGQLRVTIENRNLLPPGETMPTSIAFDPGKGLELLYRVDTFEANFLRGLVIMWAKLGLLTAAALASSSWLGFPVAVLASLVVYACAVAWGFLADAVDIYTGLDSPQATVVSMVKLRAELFGDRLAAGELWEATKTIGACAADAFLAVIPSFSRYDAVAQVATGRICSTAAAFSCLGEFGIAYPLCLLALACVLIERRDLVSTSGN